MQEMSVQKKLMRWISHISGRAHATQLTLSQKSSLYPAYVLAMSKPSKEQLTVSYLSHHVQIDRACFGVEEDEILGG